MRGARAPWRLIILCKRALQGGKGFCPTPSGFGPRLLPLPRLTPWAWSLYILDGWPVGEHINNSAKRPPDCLAACMDRALSPQSHYCLHSWGVAPGWYRSGLRPYRDCADNSSHPNKKRQRRKPCQPGATPQEEIQPQKEQGLKARSITSNV